MAAGVSNFLDSLEINLKDIAVACYKWNFFALVRDNFKTLYSGSTNSVARVFFSQNVWNENNVDLSS